MKISKTSRKGASVVDTLALSHIILIFKSIKNIDKRNKQVQFLIMLVTFNY